MTTPRLILALLILTLSAGASEWEDLPSKPAQDWRLHLKLGGAPWEIRFLVLIDQTGEMSVGRLDPKAKDKDFQWIFSKKLPQEEASGMYEAAAKTLQGFQFPTHPTDVSDGTTVYMGLTIFKRTLTIGFSGLEDARKASPDIARILDAINKHLPAKSKIW